MVILSRVSTPTEMTLTDFTNLVDSVIDQESRGNPRAVGTSGEIGLMQVKPSTASAYNVSASQLYNPDRKSVV